MNSEKKQFSIPTAGSDPSAETARQAAQSPAEDRDVQQAQKSEERMRLHKRHMKALRSLIIRLLSLVLVVYILFFHLVGLMVMPNADMYPRIDAGDLILFYRLERTVHDRDIIVFEKPTALLEKTYEGEEAADFVRTDKSFIRKALDWLGFRDPADPPMTRFVCRVVARPGDTVEITEGESLVINGNTMIETGIFYPTPLYEGFVSYPIKLGEGEYFVLADYRNGGADSRFVGTVKQEEILGTVITILRRNQL